MAWQDEMTTIVRTMVNDTSTTAPTYTDDRVQGCIVVAARLVEMELDFRYVYKGDVIAVDITPDPTDSTSVPPTRDENFINLACCKAASIIDRGSAMAAANQAIMVKDSTSVIDLRDAFKAKLSLLEKGWSAVYDDMKEEYVNAQGAGTVGAIVMGPFRVYSGYAEDRPYLTSFDPRFAR